VYDNLGLDAAWKRYQTILISDGSGGSARPMARPPRNWALQTSRVFSVVAPQMPLLRSRQVVSALAAGDRSGAYWSIRGRIDDYRLSDVLPCSMEQTWLLGQLRTRLAGLPDETQKALINWGYAICDAAMRKHVDVAAAAPTEFPYPEVSLV
jgi:NTE family protein